MQTSDRASVAVVVALWIVAVIAALFFLRAARHLLIPIVIGILVSYVLEPVVAWLAARRVPRALGAALVLLAVVALTGLGVYALRGQATSAIEAMPDAARRLREMVASQEREGPGAKVREAADELSAMSSGSGTGNAQSGAEEEGGAEPASPAPAGSGGGNGGTVPDVAGFVRQGVGSLLALAGHLTVIFFLVFFLLLSGQQFRQRVIEIAGPDKERRRRAATIIDDINAQIQRFLLVRLVTSVVVGLATWGVLAWMGVEHSAVWGLLAGVFNSIPYFGPVIVSGGLLVLGLAQGGGTTQALQMSGAALVITSLEGWLLEPPLMGKAERMSALAVFLGLLLWTWIWGAWGTILGVPMLVILKAVADHTQSLRPVGRLMAP